MAEHSKIEWTDATWNPITGCTLVSEGCRNCYAARLAATRLKDHPSRAGLARVNAAGEAKFTGGVRFNLQWLDQPLRWKRPRRIFVCAHGDLFHTGVPHEWIDRVFAVMALAHWHQFQILTKRSEKMREYMTRLLGSDIAPRGVTCPPWNALLNRAERAWIHADPDYMISVRPRMMAALQSRTEPLPDGPLPNVWLGVSVEDQATADERIPPLLDTPAAIRFVSCEPLLGQVNLHWLHIAGTNGLDATTGEIEERETGRIINGPRLDWVIAGGESGDGARPAHPDWFRSLRNQCRRAGVAFHFKQWGEWVSVSEQEGAGEHFKFPDGATVRRIGKRRATRCLDGELHDALPAA